jgi:predicted ABC-class ATPase
MMQEADLKKKLSSLDGKGYKGYKSVVGTYEFEDFTLILDHAQGDPFGAPSKVRVRVPYEQAGFPLDLYQSRMRAVALRDYVTRVFARLAQRTSTSRGSGNSGEISMDKPGQEVLERTSVVFTEEGIEARFLVGLPAKGRSIMAREAIALFCDDVREIVQRSLYWKSLDGEVVYAHAQTVEDAQALRDQLAERELVAFVADEAILPRRSGVDQRPLKKEAIPFTSPASRRITLQRPNYGEITGMAIPRGITLIVGGGYHGKTTILEAIERGVYNHLPGDGREFVVTDPQAVKVRAEDGRSIANVNISPFITNLPRGKSTTHFSSPNASGSTSQAANIMEMLEIGARSLLIDEDTSATNFMIRDRRMQALIAKEKEPITPFVDKVRALYDDYGVSTVVVLGGSGDYLDRADTVIAMDTFEPYDVTERAHEIADLYQTGRSGEGGATFGDLPSRHPRFASVTEHMSTKKPLKLKVPDTHTIRLGTENISFSAVEQLVDKSQTQAISELVLRYVTKEQASQLSVAELAQNIQRTIAEDGLDALISTPRGDLAEFRVFEWAAVLNRVRLLEFT